MTRPRIRSLSFRLALVYIGLFTLSVALLVSAYYWVEIWRPLDDARDHVRHEAAQLADTYIIDGREALIAQLNTRAQRLDARKPFHAFIAPGGAIETANLPSWPPHPSLDWLYIEADLHADGDEQDHHALALDRVFDDGARLLIGRDVEDIDEREEALVNAATWIVGVAILLGIAGGALMSVAISHRIDAVSATARRVIAGDLGGRVAIRGSGDDFDQLGETLNLMLSRIQELIESIRRISDNVAHELRTPLARLQADLEDLTQADLDEGARATLIQQALDEAHGLQATFDALLRIARIESGSDTTGLQPLDLSVLLADVTELHQPQAEQKSIALKADVPAVLRTTGDPNLLFQAFSNLLDNAIKYTPEGGTVSVSVRKVSKAELSITIADNGPGIAAEYRHRVTERFFRAPEVAQQPGVGLGLSLVSAIAAHHKAKLDFGGDDQGAVVTWTMAAS